jgi:hypothetical protein
MTNFLIALTSMITPWTVAVVCLILLGISVYYCAVDKKARDRADREREARVEAERREHLRQRPTRPTSPSSAPVRPSAGCVRRIGTVRHESPTSSSTRCGSSSAASLTGSTPTSLTD